MTFDDAYRGIVTSRAETVLAHFGIRPIIFVLGCSVETHWGEPNRLMMDSAGRPLPLCTEEDLMGFVSRGWSLGSHTMTHVRCGSTPTDLLALEFAESKRVLEERFSTEVRSFAFPWGETGPPPVEDLLRMTGYELIFGTERGSTQTQTEFSSVLKRDVVDDWWSARDLDGCLRGGLDRFSGTPHR